MDQATGIVRTEGDQMNLQDVVINALKDRTRPDDAITAAELARVCRMNERQVRAIIHDLRVAGYPIASSTDEPAGYFRATTAADLRATVQQFSSRVLHMDKARLGLNRALTLLAFQRDPFDKHVSSTEPESHLPGPQCELVAQKKVSQQALF